MENKQQHVQNNDRENIFSIMDNDIENSFKLNDQFEFNLEKTTKTQTTKTTTTTNDILFKNTFQNNVLFRILFSLFIYINTLKITKYNKTYFAYFIPKIYVLFFSLIKKDTNILDHELTSKYIKIIFNFLFLINITFFSTNILGK